MLQTHTDFDQAEQETMERAKAEIERLKLENKIYENVIHAIANIDTVFINPDGTEREWNDKEALEQIDMLVKPFWEEHCKKTWERVQKDLFGEDNA